MQLVVQSGPDAGRVFNLDRPLLVVGRQVGNDLLLTDPQVSRRHLQLDNHSGRFLIKDLGSANGTRLNGTRLEPGLPYPLKPGDSIRIGESSMTFLEKLVNQPGFSYENLNQGPGPTLASNFELEPKTKIPEIPSDLDLNFLPPVSPPIQEQVFVQPGLSRGAVKPVQITSIPSRKKRLENSLWLGLGIIGLLLGGGLIFFLGTAADRSNSPGPNPSQILTGKAGTGGTVSGTGNSPVPTSEPPTPLVNRGPGGINLPPPSPPSQAFYKGFNARKVVLG